MRNNPNAGLPWMRIKRHYGKDAGNSYVCA